MNSVWISSIPVMFALLSSSRMSSRLAYSSGVLFLPISRSSIRLVLLYTIYEVENSICRKSHYAIAVISAVLLKCSKIRESTVSIVNC